MCSGFCWWYRCQLHANTLVNASSSVGSSFESPQVAVLLSPRSGRVVPYCLSFLLLNYGYSRSAGVDNLVGLVNRFPHDHAFIYGRQQIFPWICAAPIQTSLITPCMSGNGRTTLSSHSCRGESSHRLFCHLDATVPVISMRQASLLLSSICTTASLSLFIIRT